MTLSMFLIISFMFIMTSLFMNYSHLLMSLLLLEAMMLCMVLFIPTMMYPLFQLSLMLLTFSACEASLGLSLIVKLSRNYGSDMLSISSMNKC